ncbi:MAG TPA: hypothetical protein PKH07_01085 [bacterium]|nr:hypothetical protein [bacterium]
MGIVFLVSVAFGIKAYQALGVEQLDRASFEPAVFSLSLSCAEVLWQGCAPLLRHRNAVELKVEHRISFSTATQNLFRQCGFAQPDLYYDWETDKGFLSGASSPKARWNPADDHGVATVTVRGRLVLTPPPEKGWLWSKKREPLEYYASTRQSFVIPSTYEQASADPENRLVIGTYPVALSAAAERYPKIHPDRYRVPDFFYKVTAETAQTPISPHFRIGDFDMCYPYLDYEYPQYIAVTVPLVQKLELLLERMNQDNHSLSSFTLISGFRPPEYNRGSIQKGADLKKPFSRHQYGDAVDMIIDVNPRDDVMDDLNGDGVIDIRDAEVVLKYVDELDARFLKEGSPMMGGAGVYSRHDIPERPKQSPYIHIDTRDFTNSYGLPVRWRESE